MDGRGHGARVERVDYAEGRLEIAVSDAGLCALGDEIEDGGACCLGPGSCGCGDGDEGEEFGWDGEAFAERSVDKVEEVGVWDGLAYLTCLSGKGETYQGMWCTSSSASLYR